MNRSSRVWEVLRRSFWVLPALAMTLAVGLGYALPALDDVAQADLGLFSLTDRGSARSLLQTIATVTVAVVGISFSVTVVALTLASQQLSPRVLRTFQSDHLNQSVLAVFVGTFIYALVLLTQLGTGGEPVPQISVAIALLAAIGAFGLFVAFIDNIVTSLQASTVIDRIAHDACHSLELRHPEGIGHAADEGAVAAEGARRRMDDGTPVTVTSPCGGFLTAIDGASIMRAAERCDALVVQRAPIGDYVLTEQVLAEVWAAGSPSDECVADLRAAFRLGSERSLAQDAAFPIRQLADIALRGLSPSLNDSTTAENAMSGLADALVRFAGRPGPPTIRVDGDQHPRFLGLSLSLDDLVELGFDQVRESAAGHPVVQRRLLVLLGQIERAAQDGGHPRDAIRRQQARLRAAHGGDSLG